MKIVVAILIAIVVSAVAVLLSTPDTKMTKDEEKYLLHPRNYIPPEAAAGMAKMGEMMRKQQEANKRAGVDSRGVPIPKTNTNRELEVTKK